VLAAWAVLVACCLATHLGTPWPPPRGVTLSSSRAFGGRLYTSGAAGIVFGPLSFFAAVNGAAFGVAVMGFGALACAEAVAGAGLCDELLWAELARCWDA